MDVPGWGFAGELHNDDGGFALASKGLQDKEARTLAASLSQFESAVYGEVKLHATKKAPGKPQGKERHRGIPADRQSTRPLKVQVDEWKSAFLHLRVRGDSCGCPSQESGWQWHEPCEAPPKIRQDPTPAQSAEAEAQPKVWRSGQAADAAPKSLLQVAAKVANFTASAVSRDPHPPKSNDKPVRAPRKSMHSEETPLPSAELSLEGASVSILASARAGDGHEPEEVFAQHGELQEVYAQHTDNWVITKADLSAKKMQHVGSRMRGRQRKAAAVNQDEARRQMREAEAGMPPLEPTAAAQNEAKELVFDTIWANLCPMLAPLLAGMHKLPETDAFMETDREGGEGREQEGIEEGPQVLALDDAGPPVEEPAHEDLASYRDIDGAAAPRGQQQDLPAVRPTGAQPFSSVALLQERRQLPYQLSIDSPAALASPTHFRRTSAGDIPDPFTSTDTRPILRSAGGGGSLGPRSRPPSGGAGSDLLSRHGSRNLSSPIPAGSPDLVLGAPGSRPSSRGLSGGRRSFDLRRSIDGLSLPAGGLTAGRDQAGRLANLRTGGVRSPMGSPRVMGGSPHPPSSLPSLSPPHSLSSSPLQQQHHMLAPPPGRIPADVAASRHRHQGHAARWTSNSGGSSPHTPNYGRHSTVALSIGPPATELPRRQSSPPTLPLLVPKR